MNAPALPFDSFDALFIFGALAALASIIVLTEIISKFLKK